MAERSEAKSASRQKSRLKIIWRASKQRIGLFRQGLITKKIITRLLLLSKVVFTVFDSFILWQFTVGAKLRAANPPTGARSSEQSSYESPLTEVFPFSPFLHKSKFTFWTFFVFQMNTVTVWLYEWCEGTMLPLEWPRSAAGSTSLSKE